MTNQLSLVRNRIIFEDIAERCSAVYLDNCAINGASALYRMGISYPCPNGSFGHLIGKARSFSELKVSRLRREEGFANRVKYLLAMFPHVTSTPECMEEYLAFLEHVKGVHAHLSKHSRNRRREKSEALCRISELSGQIYATLLGRANQHQGQEELMECLIKNGMNTPISAGLIKEREEGVSRADASLVSSAFIDSTKEGEKPVAIVTYDKDITNLVGNLGERCNIDPLFRKSEGIDPKKPVEVYIPERLCLLRLKLVHRFTPEQHLEHLLDQA